ncbi:hypothetical protein ACVWWD_001694 [Mesorhizobium sp. URHB0026]
MSVESPASKRRPYSRFKVKQADGVATECSSRVAKSGNQAHSFYIGDDKFTIFTEDALSPVTVGDRVRFDYEIRHLRSGYRNEYLSVVPDSLVVFALSELNAVVEGSVYILSNPSMPGLLKVGFTTGAVSKRASELSGVTSIPTGFRIEWTLPITGDPRAVEQRAHAHLAPNRHGKEFFKVSLDAAKAACIQSFAELYPDRAASMDEAFAKRAEAEGQRRNELQRLASIREEERQKELEQKAFDGSREGRWRKEGSCKVVLFDFDSEPNRNPPSFLSKLFGARFADFMEFKIEARQPREGIAWGLSVSGRIQEKSMWETREFATLEEAMDQLARATRDFTVANRRATIQVPNVLIENPPELPEDYLNPRVTLSLPSLDGLVFRPAPIIDRRSRYR